MRSLSVLRWSSLAVLFIALTACVQPLVSQSAGAPAQRTAAPIVRTPAPSSAVPGRVTRVVDGDTVVLTGIGVGTLDATTGGRRARLIGIDTPEVHGKVECLGREASAFASRALEAKDVLVAFDVDPVDRYGRALVYVWEPDGTFFNARLVAEGFALPFTVPPNVRYAELFVRLAAQARETQRGLWARC